MYVIICVCILCYRYFQLSPKIILQFERYLTILKAAMAEKAEFHDIVWSNSESFLKNVKLLSENLRNASKKRNDFKNLLSEFQDEIKSAEKTYLLSMDRVIVEQVFASLMDNLLENWEAEIEKQKTMSKRVREILLRWGCFSEYYVERAELLCDFDGNNGMRRSCVMLALFVGAIVPMVSSIPFLFALVEDGKDPSKDGLVLSSVWLALILSCLTVSNLHAVNLAFANIPLGGHTLSACVVTSAAIFFLSFSLRNLAGVLVPFESFFVGTLSFIFCDIVFGMVKFIPVKDKQMGQIKRWAIGE